MNWVYIGLFQRTHAFMSALQQSLKSKYPTTFLCLTIHTRMAVSAGSGRTTLSCSLVDMQNWWSHRSNRKDTLPPEAQPPKTCGKRDVKHETILPQSLPNQFGLPGSTIIVWAGA